jgi:iron complex outermembrane recepter protein
MMLNTMKTAPLGLLGLFFSLICLTAPAQDTASHRNADTAAYRNADTVAHRNADTVLHRRGDTLKEVRVLGQRPLTERKLDRVVVHVSNMLANTGGNALTVLENTPGVTLDEEEGSISLQGIAGVMVLIDDRPTYMSGTQLMAYLRSLPSSQIETVELLPNPGAKYPASSGAGIIIIRTKVPTKNGKQYDFSGTYAQGVYPKTNYSASLLGQQGPWQYRANLAYDYSGYFYNSDRYRDYYFPDGSMAGSVTQTYREYNSQQTVSYAASVEHKQKGQSTSWGAEIGGMYNPYHEIGNYKDGFYNASNGLDTLEQTYSHMHRSTTEESANLHILHSFTHKGRSLSADADYVRYDDHPIQTESTTYYFGSPLDSTPSGLHVSQPYAASVYSLKADYSDKFGIHTFLDAGVQSTLSVRKNEATYLIGPPGDLQAADSLDNTFQYHEQINSAYVSLRREAKQLSWDAGLRMENTSGRGVSSGNLDSTIHLNYTNLFPSAHVLWTVDSAGRHKLNLSYSRGINRPGYEALNPARFYFDQNTYFGGNPNLQPSFSNHLELAYTFLDRYTISGIYDITHQDNMLYYVADGPDFYYYTINLDHSITEGISADVSTNITRAWSVNLHPVYEYVKYYGVLPDSSLLDMGHWQLVFSGNTRYNFKQGWAAEVSATYRSIAVWGQSLYHPNGKLNLSVRKKVLKSKGTFTLSGYDVLHTSVISRYVYLPNALVHLYNTFDRTQVALTFSYSFGKKLDRFTEHETGVEGEKGRL